MNRETFLFCVTPTAGVCVGTLVALLFGAKLAQSPAVLTVAILLGVSAVSVFLAHFSARVGNRLAWLTIFSNGALMILFFAALHMSAGILCTSAVCLEAEVIYFSMQDGQVLSAMTNTDFSSALYFSTVTFTTLGYGDFQPHPEMRLVAGLEALLGYVYLGLTVGAAIDLGSNRAG